MIWLDTHVYACTLKQLCQRNCELNTPCTVHVGCQYHIKDNASSTGIFMRFG